MRKRCVSHPFLRKSRWRAHPSKITSTSTFPGRNFVSKAVNDDGKDTAPRRGATDCSKEQLLHQVISNIIKEQYLSYNYRPPHYYKERQTQPTANNESKNIKHPSRIQIRRPCSNHRATTSTRLPRSTHHCHWWVGNNPSRLESTIRGTSTK